MTTINYNITNSALEKALQEFVSNRHYHMIDVGGKAPTARKAIAQGRIFVGQEVFKLIQDHALPKGDPLLLAEIAGIQGAKKTADLIPLCHPLPLEQVTILTDLDVKHYAITVYCLVSAFAKTGVEMEALTGVQVALLTIYDLSKMVNPALTIGETRLLYKEGGKNGIWQHPDGLPFAFNHQ